MAVLATGTLAGACSSDSSSPFGEEMALGPATVPVVGTLSVSPETVWGFGRAVWAQTSDTLGTAVISTTGVFLVDGPDSEPFRLDSFDESTQVVAAVFSPETSLLATAFGSPIKVRLYDVESRTIIVDHELPSDMSVRSLSVRSSDGALIADTTLGIVEWLDPASAPPRFSDELAATGTSAVLPDGTTITPLAGTTELLVTRNGSTERVALPVDEDVTVLDAKSSPDGKLLGVSVGKGENQFERTDTIVILDSVSLERLAMIETGRATDVNAWSLADAAVAVVDDTSLSFWTTEGAAVDGAALDTPIASIHPGAGGFVTSSRDGQIVKWADGSWTPITIDPGGVTLKNVDIGSSGRLVTTVDFYGRITIWETVEQVMISSDARFATGELTGVAIGGDGGVVAASSTTGRVNVFDQALDEVWSFPASESARRVDAVALNPVTGTLATGLAERLGDLAFDDTVTSWDLSERTALFSEGGGGEDVGGCSFFNARIRFSSDGTVMATASHDFGIIVSDATTGVVLRALPGVSTILDLQFSPEGDLLVATYDDATVSVWETSEFGQVASYRGPSAYFAIGVLPDGDTMVVVDVLGALSIVDVLDGSTVLPFEGGSYRTTALAVSPDGSVVAAPTADGTIAFWSTVTGRLLVTSAQHAAPVTDLAFGPDGTWLVSSSRDGTLRSWRVVAGN